MTKQVVEPLVLPHSIEDKALALPCLTENQSDDDAALLCLPSRTHSEATTEMGDDDDEEQEFEAQTAPTVARAQRRSSLMTRLVRELSWKPRDSPRSVRHRAHLEAVASYRGVLEQMISTLQKDQEAVMETMTNVRLMLQSEVAQQILEGSTRSTVNRTRSLGLLRLQHAKARAALLELHQVIVQTRFHECEWLLQQKNAAAISEKSSLLSNDAINETEAAEVDPFFASPQQLFESNAQARAMAFMVDQLELLKNLLEEELEESEDEPNHEEHRRGLMRGESTRKSQHRTPSLSRRSSVRERMGREKAEPAWNPTAERKAELEAVLCRVETLLHSERRGEKRRRYELTEQMNAFTQLVCDHRSRTGRLLRAFVEKIETETQFSIKLRVLESSSVKESSPECRDHELFSIVTIPALWSALEGSAPHMERSTRAIQATKLPRPVAVVAFANYLKKTLIQEYVLDQGSSELILSACASALDECVHHMLFSHLGRLYMEYIDASDDRVGEEARTESIPGFDERIGVTCGHIHWSHCKQLIQGVCPDQLEFPAKLIDQVKIALRKSADRAFLPSSLQGFKLIESETTPRAIARAMMHAFAIFHQEAREVFDTKDGGFFFNADVLIPSLVLMFGRLRHPSDLTLLWRRVQLVKVFHFAYVSQACEEAYYLTCLDAAMTFVMMFAMEIVGESNLHCSICAALVRSLEIESLSNQELLPGFASVCGQMPPPLSHSTITEANESAIEELSSWIATQSSVANLHLLSVKEYEYSTRESS